MFRSAVRRVRFKAWFLLDGLLAITKTATDADHVLVVRLDAIGDFVLWIDAAEAIVKYYEAGGKRVSLLANAVWSDWANDLNIFDRVIPVERTRFAEDWAYRYQIARKVRGLRCSIVIQPAYSREFLFGDSIVRMSGALERIGSVGDVSNMGPSKKRISDRWYTRLIPADPLPCRRCRG